jgi:hypothetical protein
MARVEPGLVGKGVEDLRGDVADQLLEPLAVALDVADTAREEGWC